MVRAIMVRAAFVFAVLCSLAGCGCAEPSLMIIARSSESLDIEIADGAMVERTLEVNVDGNIVRATVEVIVEHKSPDELTITLTSPAGTDVTLGGRLADGCDFYRYALPLLDLQGEAARGTWRVRIQDASGGDAGRFVVWGLSFEALDMT